MGQEWVTMGQACLIYGVKRRTLTRWVKDGKVKSKLENNRRLILASDVRHSETDQGHDVLVMSQDVSQEMSQQALVEQLRSEIAHLEKQLESKDKQIDVKDKQIEREQMISMQLSRDIATHKERILELESSDMKRRSWWSRLISLFVETDSR